MIICCTYPSCFLTDLERYSPLDLDIERKELLKSHSITSPGIIGDSGKFYMLAITDVMPSTAVIHIP